MCSTTKAIAWCVGIRCRAAFGARGISWVHSAFHPPRDSESHVAGSGKTLACQLDPCCPYYEGGPHPRVVAPVYFLFKPGKNDSRLKAKELKNRTLANYLTYILYPLYYFFMPFQAADENEGKCRVKAYGSLFQSTHCE